MEKASKSFGIDRTGRMFFSEAADSRVASAKLQPGTSTGLLLTAGVTGLKRRKLFVRNVKTPEVVVYLGESTSVTTSNGWPLYQYDEIELDVASDATVFVIAASSGAELRVLEVE